MKIRANLIKIVYAIIAPLLLQGCGDYFDLNDNPNLVQNPPINALLSTATQKAGLNTQRFGALDAPYVQYTASPTAGAASDTYQITDNSSQWNNVYYAMSDLYDMINKAKELGATDHQAVGELLLAYQLGFVADTWGSAPYSEALGASKVLTPAFDSEESLYQTSLKLIDESIALLNKTDATVTLDSANDLIHQGKKAAWIKTAYGIKSRFLNKVSKKSSYDPNSVLSALESSYASEADEAKMGLFDGNNPWAQLAIDNNNQLLGGWLSDNFINHLNGTKYGIVDPRISKITDKTVNGDYVGTRNGQGNVGAANTIHDECYISLNSILTNKTAPIYILTFAELKLIEAEAAFRAGDKFRAYTAYLAGIKSNMDKLGVATADRDAYMKNPMVAVGSSNLTLDLIFKEKYVVTYLSPEAWNDMRRHDYEYKDFQMPVGASSYLPNFIRRIAYPADERNENGSNVPPEFSLDSPLWWDQ
ncbi:Starch-binding associating with outer membrane [bacterium A37T11]|nr:Starch-binding associating with outer membrane [bacterium A37T11]